MAQKPITTPQPKNKVASWRVFRDRALRGYKCDWNGNEAATSKTDHDMIAQLLRSRLVVIAFGFGTEEQIWLMRALPKTRLQSSHGRLARVLSLLFGVRIRGEMTAAHSIVHSDSDPSHAREKIRLRSCSAVNIPLLPPSFSFPRLEMCHTCNITSRRLSYPLTTLLLPKTKGVINSPREPRPRNIPKLRCFYCRLHLA